MVKETKYMNVIEPSLGLFNKPNENSELETECLFGESIEILDKDKDWYYCKLLTDNYTGWVKKNGLGFYKTITHRVNTNRTFIFYKNNLKSKCIAYLPMGSQLSINKIKNDWAEINLTSKHKYRKAYVPSKHIMSVNCKVLDWVKSAEQLIYTPYKWGGRDTKGIDCSALIQLSCQTIGKHIPRNTKDQINISQKVILDLDKLRRGAVIFWEGHVGVMVDKINCLHANAYHMKTVIEPLKKINKRMAGENKIIKMVYIV